MLFFPRARQGIHSRRIASLVAAERAARRRVSRLVAAVPLAAGLAAVGGCGSSTSPKPRIAFAPSTVTLTAVTGGSASGSVAVKNSGGGRLTGLAATVGAYSAGGSGWLTATLASSDAPTTLALVADATTLTAGSYSAVINVSAAGASPPTTALNVTLTVTH